MTPKEKANELVQQYVINMPLPFHIEDAKICALIAVDEILEECLQLKVEFWEKVKEEIENL
jgi:hypothetical protein